MKATDESYLTEAFFPQILQRTERLGVGRRNRLRAMTLPDRAHWFDHAVRTLANVAPTADRWGGRHVHTA